MANGARSRVLLALVALLLLTGCVGAPARSPRPGPDWSRGIQIGECSVNGVVALYPEPDGSRIHLAWPQTAEEGDRIHYAQLDSQGRTAVEVSLPLAVRSPRHVRVLPDGAGGLIICYVSGIAEGRRLYSAHLDASGRLLSEPVQVSEIDLQVDEYAAEPAAAGVDIFWSNNDYYTRGVYHLRLDQAGRVAAPSKLVAPQGISPDAKAGSDGQLHVTWVHEPDYYEENILYAAFDAGKRELAQPVRLGYFALSPRSTRFGPVLGLSSGHVHVVWSWEHLASGGTAVAGEAECRQASFPLGDPGAARERAVVMPPTSRPAYAPERGGFAYTQLARIDGGASALVYMPGFAGGQRDEAALAVSYAVSSRVGSYVWVGVTYLAGEAARGYQVAAAAKRIAMRPVLAADQHGRLHLAWLEPAGFGRYLVFYASMAPQTRAALGRLGYDDVVDAGYAVAWTLAKVASMLPIAIVWLFLPFVWIMLYLLVRVEGDLRQRGPRIALGVAIVLYILSKFFILPAGFMDVAPFMDRLPGAVIGTYVVALPMAILAVAGLVLWLHVRRREGAMLLTAYLVFGLADSLLTFLLYAPGMLGH